MLFLCIGVDHADEMIYLFIYPFPSDPPFLNEREKDLSMKMIQVWTNFAIYGLVNMFYFTITQHYYLCNSIEPILITLTSF